MLEAKYAAAEKEESKSADKGVHTLETKWRGRPLLLGMDLDSAVQAYVQSLRMAGEVVNTFVVMAAAEGITAARDVSKLVSRENLMCAVL